MTYVTLSDGLEGISVADTVLSDVDGERGRLIVRGYDIEQMAGQLSFEGMCCLLWHGQLPDDAAGEILRASLARGRQLAFQALDGCAAALRAPDGMEALRGCLGQLHLLDRQPDTHALITGALSTFVAAWLRTRHGAAPLAPDAQAGQAEDFLRMASWAPPRADRVHALDTYLVTVADHGMNASTFTARVVASTAADSLSAVVAAVCALKGPLHGGAPGPVLDMLDEIGTIERAGAWIESELGAKRRIMGMGHRVYQVRDPRAAVFERELRSMASAGLSLDRLALAQAVERAAEAALQRHQPGRRLHANVEFYTALLLDAIGLPREVFSAVFAMGRCAGWCAHIDEQRATGRLIRPSSRYTGVLPAAIAV